MIMKGGRDWHGHREGDQTKTNRDAKRSNVWSICLARLEVAHEECDLGCHTRSWKGDD